MKRLSVLLAAVLTAGCLLTACGGSDDAGTSGNSNADTTTNQNTDQNVENEGQDAGSEEAYDGFSFVYKGTKIQLNAEAAPIIAALGESDSYFESESCAFQGLDKVYTYGSIVISTYPESEVDYINIIELKDDTVETEEGVYIGASMDDVTAAYGTPVKETDTSCIYVKGNSQLSFIFEGDAVSSIVYTAITD